MTRAWNGRAVTNAIAHVIAQANGICALCGHPGANSLDHIKPRETYPELTWDPTNWQAVHLHRAGKPKGCQHPGCPCIGNRGKGESDNAAAVTASTPTPTSPSRDW